MTVAACYVCSEGIVLGADSTWAIPVSSLVQERTEERFFNYGQKILQVGDEQSPFGIVFWGLLALKELSCRTLVARLSDRLQGHPPKTVKEVAEQWGILFWDEYASAYADYRKAALELSGKRESLTPEDLEAFEEMEDEYSGGACVAGYCLPDRLPRAFQLEYSLTMTKPPEPVLLTKGPYFWGWQNMVDRLTVGIDRALIEAVLSSGKWNGTRDELLDLIKETSSFGQPENLPVREAVDLVDASLYATVKAMKFSHLAPACGGPIDIAVITTDRPFRWVRRKSLRAAIDGYLGVP